MMDLETERKIKYWLGTLTKLLLAVWLLIKVVPYVINMFDDGQVTTKVEEPFNDTGDDGPLKTNGTEHTEANETHGQTVEDKNKSRLPAPTPGTASGSTTCVRPPWATARPRSA